MAIVRVRLVSGNDVSPLLVVPGAALEIAAAQGYWAGVASEIERS